MRIETEVGKETLFSSAIPVQKPSDKQEDASNHDSGASSTQKNPTVDQNGRILLVEDDYFNRIYALTLLTTLGYRADMAENGVQAVMATKDKSYDLILMDCHMSEMDGLRATDAFLWARGQQEPYDLICLDIMMPGMSGHEFLKEIRLIEEQEGIFPPASVKVIMTSALNDSGNIMGGFVNQCEAYMVKPIDQDKLLGQIRALGLSVGSGEP